MTSEKDAWPTPLSELLAGHGPMPFRDFMAEALYADKHGYYTRRDMRHRGHPTNDTIYISGLARQLARLFERFTRDRPARIVEQGAGSGKLMRFLLASLSEALRERVEILFIEPRLARRTRLVAVLQEFGAEGKVVGSPSSIPPGPAFVIAKELVSAFPVHWVEASEDGWREVNVRFASDRWSHEEQLDTPPPHVRGFLDEHGPALEPGERYAVNLQMRGWLGEVASVLDPGVLAILDRARAENSEAGDTVRGWRDGEIVSPYHAPGRVEISAAVDLDALTEIAREHALYPVDPDPGLQQASQPHLSPAVLATPGTLDKGP